MKKIIKTILYIIALAAVFVLVYVLSSSHEVTNTVVKIGKIIFFTVVFGILFYLGMKYGGDD